MIDVRQVVYDPSWIWLSGRSTLVQGIDEESTTAHLRTSVEQVK